ncbi:hypothetical protein H0H93_007454, partial [Arthromyces matolae]
LPHPRWSSSNQLASTILRTHVCRRSRIPNLISSKAHEVRKPNASDRPRISLTWMKIRNAKRRKRRARP